MPRFELILQQYENGRPRLPPKKVIIDPSIDRAYDGATTSEEIRRVYRELHPIDIVGINITRLDKVRALEE